MDETRIRILDDSKRLDATGDTANLDVPVCCGTAGCFLKSIAALNLISGTCYLVLCFIYQEIASDNVLAHWLSTAIVECVAMLYHLSICGLLLIGVILSEDVRKEYKIDLVAKSASAAVIQTAITAILAAFSVCLTYILCSVGW
ncbi:unnamed protein product [Caenorhabditis bovis]|uniref:Uncharacterized protein n=1 Tax=Caenorhabditis bovis TaxID=2654633 RepID=A0A8S1F1K4_9PELO|nr:unnamed protein product [Caenorhabditis bovis]